MDIGVAITVTKRPQYFKEVAASWAAVRGIDDVTVHFAVEPVSEALSANMEIIQNCGLTNYTFRVNDRILGVSRNPYTALSHAFETHDYVVAGEDDILVSDDILEYHRWAADQYRQDLDVAAICSFSDLDMHPSEVHRGSFGPWVWGTWKDRWDDYVGKTWDVDMVTNGGAPGWQVGWDWHLNTRVLPLLGKVCIGPRTSHSQSIGLYGQHSTPANHVEAENFSLHREPVEFFEPSQS